MKKGLTLVEVLVAIAIVVIVAAILFPSFQSARKAAYRKQSVAQLRQLSVALSMYLDEYDQMLPYSFPNSLIAGGGISREGVSDPYYGWEYGYSFYPVGFERILPLSEWESRFGFAGNDSVVTARFWHDYDCQANECDVQYDVHGAGRRPFTIPSGLFWPAQYRILGVTLDGSVALRPYPADWFVRSFPPPTP